MKESKNFGHFRQEFDGTQPEIDPNEQEIVAELFENEIDNVMLTHIEDVESFQSELADLDESTLHLTVPLNESHLSIFVKKYNNESDSESEREISIQEIKNNRGREQFAYRQDWEGNVYRWDGGDAWAERQEREKNGLGDTFGDEDISIEGIQKKLEEVQNEAENDKLRKQMRLNKQPVGYSEVSEAIDLVKTATPVKR